MEAFKSGSDVLFVLLGAILVLAMHSGFAFLELGTVRFKNQVNALVKILSDFCASTVAYFCVGYAIAYGTTFFVGAEQLAQKNGFELVRFFFLLTFAAAVPAIVSGGIAERARFYPQLFASALIVGFVYPFFEAMVWGQRFGVQGWFKASFGEEFHDFAGSIVVHAVGGWIGLMAVLLLGARQGRYTSDGRVVGYPPSSIPFLALGAWILSVGWFGFNVMSAQAIDKVSGLVAVNSSAKADVSRTREDRVREQGGTAREYVAKHPVVRIHPETGRKALYVNVAHTARFKGMTDDESAPLLEYLFRHQVKPEFTCRFQWRAGSIAFWDNRCTQHNPVNDYHGYRRVMHRITLAGEKPQ